MSNVLRRMGRTTSSESPSFSGVESTEESDLLQPTHGPGRDLRFCDLCRARFTIPSWAEAFLGAPLWCFKGCNRGLIRTSVVRGGMEGIAELAEKSTEAEGLGGLISVARKIEQVNMR